MSHLIWKIICNAPKIRCHSLDWGSILVYGGSAVGPIVKGVSSSGKLYQETVTASAVSSLNVLGLWKIIRPSFFANILHCNCFYELHKKHIPIVTAVSSSGKLYQETVTASAVGLGDINTKLINLS